METLEEDRVLNYVRRTSVVNTTDTGSRRQSQRKRSSVTSLRAQWKLKYQDFPANVSNHSNNNNNNNNGNSKKDSTGSKSEAFQKLIDRANAWLKNSDATVKSCETLTWMGSNNTRVRDGEQMVLSKKLIEGAVTYYGRGLRLWLVPRQSSRQQILHFEDFVPADNDRLDELVHKINRKFEHKHLAGKIISIDTVSVPVLKSKVRHCVTGWSENVEEDAPYAFILRVFYTKEAVIPLGKLNLSLSIKDIVPMPIDGGYEGFEVLAERANCWLKEQHETLIIINMQSVMVQKDQGAHLDLGKSCFFNMPGINNFEPVEFFRVLRVYILKVVPNKHSKPVLVTVEENDETSEALRPESKNDAEDETQRIFPVSFPFIYETFTPELIREKDGCDVISLSRTQMERLEEMRETFSKVMAFLRNSGADVLCAETVMNPMQIYCDDIGQDDEMKFLFTIRLYLTGQIGQLMNGGARPIKRVSSSSNLDDGLLQAPQKKHHRTSPLFLRSVVSRQFKYRWLILAISAFTCMAIIVTVSVVYSNNLW